MKHAFLLGVYKNPNYIDLMINRLVSSETNVYIHVNKLYISDFKQLQEKYKFNKNVIFTDCVNVKWGGLGFLDSVLLMMKEALKDNENQVFHLISGQDVQTVSVAHILDFFKDNKNNYLEYRPLPDNRKHYYDYYWLNNLIEVRAGSRLATIPGRLLQFQMKYGIKRKALPFKQPYFGSCWCSLQRDAVVYIYDTLMNKKNGIYNRLKYVFAPDEMIFQSILVNANRFSIINNNLRYIRWSPNNTGSPDLLIEKDFETIKESEAFFARKIDPTESKGLIDKFCLL